MLAAAVTDEKWENGVVLDLDKSVEVMRILGFGQKMEKWEWSLGR